MPSSFEDTPSLGDALYSALQLSRRRLRFMAIFTVLVSLVTVGQAMGAEPTTTATAVVDLAAFVPTNEATFEVQSLTDAFTSTVTTRRNLERVAEEISIDVDTLRAGVTVDAESGATQVTVSYADVDEDLATDVAVVAARQALREIADRRAASAQRDVTAATERVADAEEALSAFEAEAGATDVPAQYERLSTAVNELTISLGSSADRAAGQAALDAALAEQARLEPFVRRGESLVAEHSDAIEQLLEANEQVSRARTLATAADAGEVIRTGFSSRDGRLKQLLPAAATGVFVGVVASYLITWVIFRRRTR